jgi:hypothetical protein
VIDKAAMDALMTEEGDVWDPAQKVLDQAHRMCSGISGVLHPCHGLFLQISFAQTHFRRRYLLGPKHRELAHTPTPTDTLSVTRSSTAMTRHRSNVYSDSYGWFYSYETFQREGGCFHKFFYVCARGDHTTGHSPTPAKAPQVLSSSSI